jgi:hypothetical protein
LKNFCQLAVNARQYPVGLIDPATTLQVPGPPAAPGTKWTQPLHCWPFEGVVW